MAADNPGSPPRRTSGVLDAWLQSRRGPAADAFSLRRSERLHAARVYPGRVAGYRLEILSKTAPDGIGVVATLLRADGTISFQRRWDALDEAGYAAAVEEVEHEVGRLGLCDIDAVRVHGAGDDPAGGHADNPA